MTGIKKINLISAVLVSLSLCGGCTLEKAGNSSQDQTVQEDNETEQVKAEKAEKELGWKAEFGIKEMCEDSWRWQSNNPNGYEE